MSYFWVRYLYLVGDNEDDGLDGALEVRCEVIFAKVWDHIVFSFFMDSFVIGFAIVEIPLVVISKKSMLSELCGSNMPENCNFTHMFVKMIKSETDWCLFKSRGVPL
jgi:hypothetical protein